MSKQPGWKGVPMIQKYFKEEMLIDGTNVMTTRKWCGKCQRYTKHEYRYTGELPEEYTSYSTDIDNLHIPVIDLSIIPWECIRCRLKKKQ